VIPKKSSNPVIAAIPKKGSKSNIKIVARGKKDVTKPAQEK